MGNAISGNPFRRLTRGEKLTVHAQAWNALMDLAEREGSRGLGISNPQSASPRMRENIVFIQNSSGGDLAAGNVLGISGVDLTHTDNPGEFIAETRLTGTTPTTASHSGKFAVLCEPIPDGAFGRAVVYGLVAAQVNIVTEGDEWCEVTNSDATKLTSGATGSAQIIYAPSGTGTKWCVIRFGSVSSGTISGLITGNAAGDGKYTGKSFADVTSDVSASGTLAEADFGTLAGSNDCLVLNPVELGSSETGHDVTATVNTDHFAIYFTGRLVRVNADGTKVIHAMLFYAGCVDDDTPATIDGGSL